MWEIQFRFLRFHSPASSNETADVDHTDCGFQRTMPGTAPNKNTQTNMGAWEGVLFDCVFRFTYVVHSFRYFRPFRCLPWSSFLYFLYKPNRIWDLPLASYIMDIASAPTTSKKECRSQSKHATKAFRNASSQTRTRSMRWLHHQHVKPKQEQKQT